MQSRLIDAVNDIRRNRALVSTDEASTKAGVVELLLSLLGWNTFNIEEVKREYTVAGKRVDYALRISNANKVFIEVKRIGEELEKHQEQLLGYSFQEGVKLAVLTNGATWWFYLPLSEGSWEQRRFYAIEMSEQDPNEIAEKFMELLAKDNIKSGEALNNAERLYKSRQKAQKLKEAIPRAWTKIISDPDDLLVELLVETTEKISGFRPDIWDIEEFLWEYNQSLHQPPITPPVRNRNDTKIKKPALITPTTSYDYINKKPLYFMFLGKRYQPRNWPDLMMVIAAKLYQKHKSDFGRCLGLRGSRKPYFSLNPDELRIPKQISNSNFYAETNLNSNSIVKISRALMTLFGYKDSDLEIVAE